ncbi:MAG: hypothetical protein ACREV2_05380 [Burkholderiales bacterium]
MRSMWKISACALAVICFGAVAEVAPQKEGAKDEGTGKVQQVKLPDPASLKQYIDAHRGL